MALPPGFRLDSFLERVDQDPDLRGARVIYFAGQGIAVLREGTVYCAPGLLSVVLRDDVDGNDVVLHSPVAAQTRDGKAQFEIRGAGSTALTGRMALRL